MNFLPPDLTHPNPTPPDHRNPTPDLSEVASTSVSRPNLWRIRTYLSEPRRRWRDPKAPHRWLRGGWKMASESLAGEDGYVSNKNPKFFFRKNTCKHVFFGMFRVYMNQWNLLVSFIKLRKIIFIFFIILMRFQCQTGGNEKNTWNNVTNRGLISDGKSAKKKSEFLAPSSLRSQLGIHTFSALGIFFGRVSFLGSFLFQKKISAKLSLVSWSRWSRVNLLRWLPGISPILLC